MDDDTAGDNTSTREMLYGAGGHNVYYDSTGPLSSTSCRQGMNADGSNFISAGFGQSTGYWTGNEVQIPAAAVPRVRPPLKSMTQTQPQQNHPSHATNMNMRINQVPRHYYENSLQQPGQHSNSNSNSSGILPPGYEQARPQQMGQLAVMEQQPMMLEDLFGSPAGMGVMSRQAHQQGLKDYSVHHQQQQQQQQQQFQQATASAAGMRPFIMENSPSLPVGLDFFNGEPFDGTEFWTIDSNGFGGPLVQQHRNSLTPDPLMFHQRPMASAGGNGANQPYQIAHATYESTRRSTGLGRHDVAPPPRTWVPSQVNYDNTPPLGMKTTLVAPPRTSGARASGSSSSRKSTRRASDGEMERKRPRANYSPMAGENRLKISFVGLGTPGESPQHFGTKGFIIPDGLSGMHQVYHQRWRFDIRHEKIEDTICVFWSITNMASGTTCSRTETPREARVRETSGHTICNQLLRQALKSRALELEQSLLSLRDNPTKYSNTESLIKALRPKSCILGLLFFGLLHDCVQQRMKEMVRNPSAIRIERPIIPQQPPIQQQQPSQPGVEGIPVAKLEDEDQGVAPDTTVVVNDFGEDLGGVDNNADVDESHESSNGGDDVVEENED